MKTAAYCQYDYTSYYSYYSTYCEYGCCGSKYSSYSDVCCVQNLAVYSSADAGIIAGAVIGSLVGLAILIGLIVLCCVAANNSKRRTGVVLQPPNPTTQTFVARNTTDSQVQSTNPAPYGPVGYGYPGFGPPPAYSQFNYVSHGGTDPAYPPTPAANY